MLKSVTAQLRIRRTRADVSACSPLPPRDQDPERALEGPSYRAELIPNTLQYSYVLRTLYSVRLPPSLSLASGLCGLYGVGAAPRSDRQASCHLSITTVGDSCSSVHEVEAPSGIPT